MQFSCCLLHYFILQNNECSFTFCQICNFLKNCGSHLARGPNETWGPQIVFAIYFFPENAVLCFRIFKFFCGFVFEQSNLRLWHTNFGNTKNSFSKKYCTLFTASQSWRNNLGDPITLALSSIEPIMWEHEKTIFM